MCHRGETTLDWGYLHGDPFNWMHGEGRGRTVGLSTREDDFLIFTLSFQNCFYSSFSFGRIFFFGESFYFKLNIAVLTFNLFFSSRIFYIYFK